MQQSHEDCYKSSSEFVIYFNFSWNFLGLCNCVKSFISIILNDQLSNCFSAVVAYHSYTNSSESCINFGPVCIIKEFHEFHGFKKTFFCFLLNSASSLESYPKISTWSEWYFQRYSHLHFPAQGCFMVTLILFFPKQCFQSRFQDFRKVLYGSRSNFKQVFHKIHKNLDEEYF